MIYRKRRSTFRLSASLGNSDRNTLGGIKFDKARQNEDDRFDHYLRKPRLHKYSFCPEKASRLLPPTKPTSPGGESR